MLPILMTSTLNPICGVPPSPLQAILGKAVGRDPGPLLSPGMEPQELLKNCGRYHSRLQNVEYECWVYRNRLPRLLSVDPYNAYFWRRTYDPYTLAEVEAA